VTLFPTTVAACFFGYLYLRTKSLIPGIGLHTFTTLWGVLV
jgi:membrane protease YdiL (CAAX protease family)